MVARTRRMAVTAAATVVGAGVAVTAAVIVPASAGGDDGARRVEPRAAQATTAAPQPRPAGRTRAPAATPPEPTAAHAPARAPEPAPEPRAAAAQADRTVHRFLDVSNAVRSRGALDRAALGQVAQGFARGEIEASADEFARNGWRQLGTAKVVDVRTVRSDLDASPPSVTVWACVDSSGLRVVGQDGQPVPGYADKPDRVPQLYTMQRSGGRWKVSGHGFPREPTC